jgi:two-component system nitrogen regulation response regulator GlnG
MDAFRNFDWPGNVRQLVNATRRVMVAAPGNEIRMADVPQEFVGTADVALPSSVWTTALADWAMQHLETGCDEPLLSAAQSDFERVLIVAALRIAQGRKQDAARLLGWGRNTLTRKIKDLNLET